MNGEGGSAGGGGILNFAVILRCGSLALAGALAKVPPLALPTNFVTLPFGTGDDDVAGALADAMMSYLLPINLCARARYAAGVCEDCELFCCGVAACEDCELSCCGVAA